MPTPRWGDGRGSGEGHRVGLGQRRCCYVSRGRSRYPPPTPTVTRAPGRFHRLSDLSSQGLWGHRLVQLRANSTAGNKQQPSSQLVSWAPALLRGIHRPTQSWPAYFLLWTLSIPVDRIPLVNSSQAPEWGPRAHPMCWLFLNPLHGLGPGVGFGVIQAHHVYCALR